MIAIITRVAGLAGFSLAPFWAGFIAFGIIAGSLGIAGIKLYEAGRASAQAECQAEALQSEIDAMKKDRDDARSAAADASLKLAALAAQTNEQEQRTTQYVEELQKRPAPDCALTDDDLRGLRERAEPGRPRPRSASRPRIHGPGRGAAGKAR